MSNLPNSLFIDRRNLDALKLRLYNLETRHDWRRIPHMDKLQNHMETYVSLGGIGLWHKHIWKHYYRRIPSLLGAFWRLVEGGNIHA